MLFANVIFHAFEAAYLSWLFLFPLAVIVLAAEAAILWAFNREASVKVILACALAMNVASYVVGYWVSPMLFVGSGLVVVDPDEHGYGILGQGPEWRRLARHSFLQAGLVSIVIEVVALLPLRKRAKLRRIVVPVILGNCLSYTLLGLGFVSMFGG
jgi:hypothetical protein